MLGGSGLNLMQKKRSWTYLNAQRAGTPVTLGSKIVMKMKYCWHGSEACHAYLEYCVPETGLEMAPCNSGEGIVC